jgi:ATP-dependent DNA helicase RecG
MYGGSLSQQSRARLNTLRESNDGFEIARRDLELRGPGEVLGTRQTGDMRFRIADLLRDAALLEKVDAAARQLGARHPSHCQPLVRRWVGQAAHYGDV